MSRAVWLMLFDVCRPWCGVVWSSLSAVCCRSHVIRCVCSLCVVLCVWCAVTVSCCLLCVNCCLSCVV